MYTLFVLSSLSFYFRHCVWFNFVKCQVILPAFTGWLLLFFSVAFFGHEIFISDLKRFFPILPCAARRRNDDATVIWYDIACLYFRSTCVFVCKLERKKLKWDISTWEMLFWVWVSLFISGYLWLNSILVPFFLALVSYAFIMCVALFLFFCMRLLLLVSNCVGLASHSLLLCTRNFHVKYFTRCSILYDCI